MSAIQAVATSTKLVSAISATNGNCSVSGISDTTSNFSCSSVTAKVDSSVPIFLWFLLKTNLRCNSWLFVCARRLQLLLRSCVSDGRHVYDSELQLDVLVHMHRRLFRVGHFVRLEPARAELHAELLFCDRRTRRSYPSRLWHRHHTRRHLCLLRRASVCISNVVFINMNN